MEQNVFFDGFFKRFLKKKASISRSDTQDDPEPQSNDNENNNDDNNSLAGNDDEDSSANNFGQYKSANEFLVPMGGKMVNICDKKYFNIASLAHDKIRDIWTAVCHGHSGKQNLLNFSAHLQNLNLKKGNY